MSEYIYKNSDDTIRIKIFTRETGLGTEWDYDAFFRNGDDFLTFSQEAGDLFKLRRDAKEGVESEYGKLTSINPIDTVTNGWQ